VKSCEKRVGVIIAIDNRIGISRSDNDQTTIATVPRQFIDGYGPDRTRAGVLHRRANTQVVDYRSSVGGALGQFDRETRTFRPEGLLLSAKQSHRCDDRSWLKDPGPDVRR
jgi:hypothetical protein